MQQVSKSKVSETTSKHYQLIELIEKIMTNIQPWPLPIKRLLNNPYVNGVNLTKQNPLLKCRQHLETLHTLKKGLDLLMLKILGL